MLNHECRLDGEDFEANEKINQDFQFVRSLIRKVAEELDDANGSLLLDEGL